MDVKYVEGVIKKYNQAQTEQSNWKTYWAELAKYFVPAKNNVYGIQTGPKKETSLFDSIGVLCVDRLSAYLHGMLVNASTQWFNFSTGNPLIDAQEDVALWLQDCAKLELSVLNNSNFQTEVHEVFVDLAGIGTSNLQVEEDDKAVVNFKSQPIYETCILEDVNGEVTTIFYEYELTLEQVKEAYGEDSLNDNMKRRIMQNPIDKIKILHCIDKSTRLAPPMAHIAMEFTSIHIALNDKHLLRKSGFEEMPVIISRFSKLSGEMYGRSQSMKALADTKMANEMKRAILESAQLANTPPIMVPDDGFLMPIRTAPRSILTYRAGTKDRIEPLNIGGNVTAQENFLELVHKSIEEAFFLDQLHLVENDRMTATEVMQRRDEHLRTMSPYTSRMQQELLKPVVQRVFGIMFRKNLFPKAPEALQGQKLEIKFVSQIARAQESVIADNFQRSLALITQLAQLNPAALDYLDIDEATKFSMRVYGAPLQLIKKTNIVVQERQQREEMQQAAQQAEIENQQSQATKNNAQASAVLEE